MARDLTHEERRQVQQVCPTCDKDLWDLDPRMARDDEGVYTVADEQPFKGACPSCKGDLGGPPTDI